MSESFIESSWTKQDTKFEVPLRPQSLDDFIGQESVRKKLHVFIQAAKQRKEALGHCLFCGPPGLGKTTLSHILAKTMNSNLVVTSGPVLDKPGDLAGILTNLNEGDVLFIDEIHRISKTIEEYLYSAIEDFRLDLMIDSGPNARSVQVDLKPFTLVGATTRAGLISSPMRSRFQMQLRLDYYEPTSLTKIIERTSQILKLPIDPAASLEIAHRSRGTPRIANNLLKWVRDFAETHHHSRIDHETSIQALEMLSIDHKGLDEMDKKILSVMMEHHNGGPVGLQTIAIAVGEEQQTLAEIYEPFLIMQGFIKRTPRGRVLTDLAYEHLGQLSPRKN